MGIRQISLMASLVLLMNIMVLVSVPEDACAGDPGGCRAHVCIEHPETCATYSHQQKIGFCLQVNPSPRCCYVDYDCDDDPLSTICGPQDSLLTCFYQKPCK